MMLSRSIKNLVVRAARFYQEPFAIHIQRQGIDGNQKATECFDALKRCRDGTVGIASEDWETYRDILQPESAETCQTKAAQTIIDWRREEFRNERPWGPLVSWLTASGNFALAAKLTPPESANASASTVQAVQKRRRKELAVQRQRKYVRRKLPEKCMMRVIGDQMRRTRVIKAKK